MAMLRFSLCMFAIFLASLAAGCREKLPVAPAAKAVVIGVNDGFCRQTHSLCVGEDRLREYAGLAKVLSEKTGRRIELKYLNTEAQLIDAYKAGGLDGVICKTWAALRAGGAGGRELHRLADLSMPGGPNLLEGIFFVRADSPIKTMADLAGRTLGMGGPDAYEKSLAVTARLKQAGVAPAAVKVIPTCVAMAAAVRDGEVDAGVLSSYAYLYGTLQAADFPEAREIARTASIPFMSFAVSDTMDPASRDRLKAALLELSTTGAPADLGATKIMPAAIWQAGESRP